MRLCVCLWMRVSNTLVDVGLIVYSDTFLSLTDLDPPFTCIWSCLRSSRVTVQRVRGQQMHEGEKSVFLSALKTFTSPSVVGAEGKLIGLRVAYIREGEGWVAAMAGEHGVWTQARRKHLEHKPLLITINILFGPDHHHTGGHHPAINVPTMMKEEFF